MHNSFSYGVLANIGSGAVPGRLLNHGFRESSGTGFRGSVPGQVTGQVAEEGSGKGLFGAGSGQGFKEVPGGVRGVHAGF